MAHRSSRKSPRLSFLAGMLAGPALLILALAATARYLPDSSIFQMVGRIADSVAPHLLAIVFGLSLIVAILGARWIASILILGISAALLGHAWMHFQRTEPLAAGAPVHLRVLWFNMFGVNDLGTEEIVSGLSESNADVVVLAESERMLSRLDKLREEYPYQLGCTQRCQVLVLSRLPFEGARQGRLSVMSPERYGRVVVRTEAGLVTVVGAHLNKPWFDEFSTDEAHRLAHRLEAVSGPVVMVGDMNAAPWSRRMVHLHMDTDLRFAPLPPATWPSIAGDYGVPIDNAMVGGGARFVTLESWGQEMGSNHLGLLAEITLDQS